MSTPEKRPTVRVNIADINQDGLSQANKEGLISTFTEEYKKRLRNLLPGLDLRFIKWERDQGEEPKVYCNCGHLEPAAYSGADAPGSVNDGTPSGSWPGCAAPSRWPFAAGERGKGVGHLGRVRGRQPMYLSFVDPNTGPR